MKSQNQNTASAEELLEKVLPCFTKSNTQEELEEAKKCCKKAAEMGLAEAQYQWGRLLSSYEYVEEDTGKIDLAQTHLIPLETLKWWLLAAEQGDPQAALALKRLDNEELCLKQIDKATFEWLKEAGKRKNIEVLYRLACVNDGEYVTNGYFTKMWMKEAAEKGHPVAQYRYGVTRYEKPGHTEEAINWFRLSAEQGYRKAQYRLGLLYASGEGVEKDEAMALNLFQLAAAQDCVDAIYQLGLANEKGTDSQQLEEAIKHFKAAAGKGHVDATFHLGLAYEYGRGVEQSFVQAAKMYLHTIQTYIDTLDTDDLNDTYPYNILGRKLPDLPQTQENALAHLQHIGEHLESQQQCALADLFFQGQIVAKNYTEAIHWYKLAADKCNSYAQWHLAIAYENGFGVRKNKCSALKWYKQAAENGNADAQLFMGRAYENGEGVDQDNQVAFDWYKMAAEQSNEEAQSALARFYETGKGGDQDMKAAFEWYKNAAESGNADAAYALAKAYASGNGVEKNEQEAVNWFLEAAESGHVEAQYIVAGYYATGNCLEKDESEAFKWYCSAAEEGHALAKYEAGCRCIEGEMNDHYDMYEIIQEYSEGFEWLKSAADDNYPLAQYRVALCYEDGTGVKPDFATAMTWLEKAAENGCDEAKAHLKEIEESVGVLEEEPVIDGAGDQVVPKRKDFGSSDALLAAAKSGDAEAQYQLGQQCHEAEGNEQNRQDAIDWLTKAANQNHADAQFALAHIYEVEVERNSDDIIGWQEIIDLYDRAARNGSSEAAFYLGETYNVGYMPNCGYGVGENEEDRAVFYYDHVKEGPHYAKACYEMCMIYSYRQWIANDIAEMDYLKKAAMHGHADAQYELGYSYLEGCTYHSNSDFPCSVKQGVKWLCQAAMNGSQQAKTDLCKIYSEGKLVKKNLEEAEKWRKYNAKKNRG